MPSSASAGPAARRPRSVVAAAVLAAATLIGVLGCQAPFPPMTGPSSDTVPSSERAPAKDSSPPRAGKSKTDSPDKPRKSRGAGASGRTAGVVPDGTTVFDDDVPGVAKLDPALLRAVREAATDAAEDGVEFVVNSGWRSAAYQERLLREAIAKYGSKKEAARWVAAPDKSLHVSGDAIDLGPAKATDWLADHGADYGLCQIYRNEPWHYELRPDAADEGCPPMYDDPTQDPRTK